MKRILSTLVLGAGFSTTAIAGGLGYGATATTGPSSNHFSLFAISNPAMGALMVPESESWRFAYFPNISSSTEVGNVDNFVDDLDDLIDIIDDPTSTSDSAQEVLDRFNGVLGEMGDNGYVKTTLGVSAPLMPLFVRSDSLGGTLSVELDLKTQVGLRILDDELSYDDQTGSFSTNTSAYVKSGIQTKLALGYSFPLLTNYFETSSGQLYGGVKMGFTQMELSKQVIALQQLDGKDVDNIIEDEYDNNLRSTTGLELDLGLLWVADNYRLGLTLSNLNSPSYKYGAVGENCDSYEEASSARAHCETATYFVQVRGELKARETHTKHAVATVDASYFLSSRWVLSSSLDLAAYDDMVGQENQWLHLSTAYEAKGSWLPSWRFGYQQNLAGTELAATNVGLTLFRVLTLDLIWGTESVTVEGSTVPRQVGFSVGFQERF